MLHSYMNKNRQHKSPNSTTKQDIIIRTEDETAQASTATLPATWSRSRLPWEVISRPLQGNSNKHVSTTMEKQSSKNIII
jgi:hypothetical protein